MIIKLCSVLVALKPGGYRMHPTGKGTEGRWQHIQGKFHPAFVSILCLLLCFSPPEVLVLSGTTEAVSSQGDVAKQGTQDKEQLWDSRMEGQGPTEPKLFVGGQDVGTSGVQLIAKLVWNDTLQRLETGALRFRTSRKQLHIHLGGNDTWKISQSTTGKMKGSPF